MALSDFINILQATISPVVMISGTGLICLVIQTRYGRIVDRIRQLIHEQQKLQQEAKELKSKINVNRLENIDLQIELLLNRVQN